MGGAASRANRGLSGAVAGTGVAHRGTALHTAYVAGGGRGFRPAAIPDRALRAVRPQYGGVDEFRPGPISAAALRNHPGSSLRFGPGRAPSPTAQAADPRGARAGIPRRDRPPQRDAE